VTWSNAAHSHGPSEQSPKHAMHKALRLAIAQPECSLNLKGISDAMLYGAGEHFCRLFSLVPVHRICLQRAYCSTWQDTPSEKMLILGVCILLHVWYQGESVFRLRNFNIVGFYYLFNCATCFGHTTILWKYVYLKMVVWPKHVAQLNKY
jgi:hypothetical protein